MTIEEAVMQELAGDVQKQTLDFVLFLRSNGMEFVRGDGYWANQYYWYVRYMGEDVCYVLVNGKGEEQDSAPLAVWSETSDSSDGAWYEAPSVDGSIKEIVWDNVDFCGKCTPGGPCYGGLRKTVFGKEFSGVCRCTFRFVRPDADELECIKGLVAIRKKAILNGKNDAGGK